MDPTLWREPDQVIRVYARDLQGGQWYTNPHGNELPGPNNATLSDAKAASPADYHAPTIVLQLRDPVDRPRERLDMWSEKDWGRDVAGCLTDWEVMARQGLVHVKVVLDASEEVPDSGGAASGEGVQAQLREILERIKPSSPDSEYTEIKAIADTVDFFVPIALKGHGMTADNT